MKRLAKAAGKKSGEPLGPEDWKAYFELASQPSTRAGKWVLRTLPSSPRCGFCGAPFAGFGGALVRPLGFRPSTKNPSICGTCVELSPPGGTTMDLGVLFADVRGFTTLSEREGADAARLVLRDFYACAEAVLFPEALIDKVIGDAVMALYVPSLVTRSAGRSGAATPGEVVRVMVSHARELLERMGYASGQTPPVGVGIGLAYGEAFIGHVGSGTVHDFTAVGDVVNTASRLQGAAAPGEVVLTADLAALLDDEVGAAETLTLKGKEQAVPVRRVRWFT
jgi:adenylate cyclase